MSGWKSGVEAKKTKTATKSPSTLDVAWAAGLFEGEGTTCFNIIKGPKKNRGTETAAVYQKDPFILHKLVELFGGSIGCTKQKTGFNPGDMWYWRIYGSRARGFLQTVYTFLSPRRRLQVNQALTGHKKLTAVVAAESA
jgi:hypothetical protein